MSTPSALLKVMSDAARKAARGLNRDFGELAELQASRQGAADFVSAADIKAEQSLFESLSKARPGYSFLGEERGLIEDFAINIALQREGVVVAAVTYNPVANELFWAEKGKGAFVNDRRLRVAARQRLDESVLATGIPFLGHGQHARFLKELHQISQRVAGVRRFGAAALDLAWVAAGRMDGFWERDLSAWDLAAGLLLVTEAGGKVTTAEGGEDVLATGSVCAANLDLHPLILERLRAAA